SDDQRAMIIQLAEYTLGQFYSRKRHRNRPRAKLRFVAHAFSYFQSGLEHAVQDRAGFAAVQRNLVRIAHLPEDFRFAEQHGIEPRGDAEQMPHGVAVTMPVERA